jgi:ATP/maltotriose-dependent transcriptional regulator MalT
MNCMNYVIENYSIIITCIFTSKKLKNIKWAKLKVRKILLIRWLIK